MAATDSRCEQRNKRLYRNHLQSCNILVADKTHPSHPLNFGGFPEVFSCSLVGKWWAQKHFGLWTCFHRPQPLHMTPSSRPHDQLHLYILLPRPPLYLISHENHTGSVMQVSMVTIHSLVSTVTLANTYNLSNSFCLFIWNVYWFVYQCKPCISTQICIFPGIKRKERQQTEWCEMIFRHVSYRNKPLKKMYGGNQDQNFYSILEIHKECIISI